MLTTPDEHRFKNHVGFDNLPIGEATKNNIPSLTLNKKHKGYRAGRRSRTFMVGVDEHSYSDYALQWLLDELVDDGDEVVCVRVIEKEFRATDSYSDEGRAMLQAIMDKNTNSKALSFVLEFASGKLHGTFQKLIHMHQPAMLIVGTRGRSLGGIQGLVNTRNSFSKYCLQYSPVPVVVVRPTEKRNKKKEKRAHDVARQTYVSMLASTNGKHEADSDSSHHYDLETQFSADEEAHQVAKVLGLPASFDPTIKPLNHIATRTLRPSTVPLQMTEVPEDGPAASTRRPSAGSESSDSEDEEGEADFDVVPGENLLNQHKMEKIHEMEVGEAAALRRRVEEDDDSDDDNPKEKSTS